MLCWISFLLLCTILLCVEYIPTKLYLRLCILYIKYIMLYIICTILHLNCFIMYFKYVVLRVAHYFCYVKK
jgi:hypothetical protein